MPRAIYGAANLMFAKNYFNHVSSLEQLFKGVLKIGCFEKFGKYHQKHECKECFFFRFLTCNSTIKREILLYEKKYVTVFLGLIFPNNFQWFKKVAGKIEGLTSCWSYIWNLLFLYYYLKLKTHCCANFCATKYIFGYFDWSIKDSSKWKHIINRLKGRTHSTAPVHVYLLGRG